MKKIKLGLLPQISDCHRTGIAAGTVSPELPVRVFVTFNALFSQFLNFIIPLIIVGLVTPAIADIGKGAGKMLVATVLLAYGATLFSGFLSFGIGETFFPDLLPEIFLYPKSVRSKGVTPFFTVAIPEPLNVMTALVMAFTVGLGLAHLDTSYLKMRATTSRKSLSRRYSCHTSLASDLHLRNLLQHDSLRQVFHVLAVFVKIIGIIFLLHIFLLIFQYCIAGMFVGKNPFRLLGRMMPAYFTALGTQSSAATIPVTLKQTIQNGVNEGIAGFVILCVPPSICPEVP